MSDVLDSAGKPPQAALSLNLRHFARTEQAGEVDRLFEEHYDPLYRYLVLTGSAPADADEILQDAFIRLIRFLGEGKRIEKPRDWLFRVCYNLRLDEARQARRRPRATPDELRKFFGSQADPMPDPESAAIEQENLARMRTALGQLTERQYEYLLMRAEGMRLREIADLYGVSVQAVADACGRAMERLGKLIHD